MRQPRETGDLSQICTRTLIWRIRVGQELFGGGQQTCQVASSSNRQHQHHHLSMSAPQLPTCFYPSFSVTALRRRGSCENYIQGVPSGWRSYSILVTAVWDIRQAASLNGITGRATVPPGGGPKTVSPILLITLITSGFWITHYNFGNSNDNPTSNVPLSKAPNLKMLIGVGGGCPGQLTHSDTLCVHLCSVHVHIADGV